MSDLIDREELKKAAKKIESLPWGDEEGNRVEFQWYPKELEYLIDKAPSAEPKIIRCKDCKWCVEHYDTDGNAPYWICKNWDGGTDADGFCYEAERRTNG